MPGVCGTGDQTQDFMHAGHILYQLSYMPVFLKFEYTISPFSWLPWTSVTFCCSLPLVCMLLRGAGLWHRAWLAWIVSCGSLFLCELDPCLLAGCFWLGFVCLQGR